MREKYYVLGLGEKTVRENRGKVKLCRRDRPRVPAYAKKLRRFPVTEEASPAPPRPAVLQHAYALTPLPTTTEATTTTTRITRLVRGVPKDELPLVLLERARVPADDLAPEVYLGADKSEGRPQSHRGDGDAEMLGPVRWNAFQGQGKRKGVVPEP